MNWISYIFEYHLRNMCVFMCVYIISLLTLTSLIILVAFNVILATHIYVFCLINAQAKSVSATIVVVVVVLVVVMVVIVVVVVVVVVVLMVVVVVEVVVVVMVVVVVVVTRRMVQVIMVNFKYDLCS